eukprot:CAMPEP_0176264728 /NCGR_PEP_ID=MMETSP0121_2-20121125/41778_1 /TAXON_ID=160619 /ORGANISM="Kryptoperidinium foliaceum, Strain CCMP 1326" /LENGTH=54 /DNA_ID=CAMNT_0017604739 /DNA_START=37 /DNA_END=201 /DNA_ORIENTATION=+
MTTPLTIFAPWRGACDACGAPDACCAWPPGASSVLPRICEADCGLIDDAGGRKP